MKKYGIVISFIILFSACIQDNEYNIEEINAPKNINIFEESFAKLDYINAGTSFYKNERDYDFLIDVSKEDDYEKYFPKEYDKYLGDYKTSKIQQQAEDFMDVGTDLTSAYKIITYFYENKDNISSSVKFEQYCYPKIYLENEFKDGHKVSCYGDFQKGSETYRAKNLALLKARNMLLYALNNDLKNEKDKIKADAHMMIALSYLAQDELYNLSKIKEHIKQWEELGGKKIRFFNKKKNKALNTLFNYIAENENIDIIDILNKGVEEGFSDTMFSSAGVYNFLNDDDYIPVAVVKRAENKYAVNPFFTEYENARDALNYIGKLVPSVKPKGMISYDFGNNLDELYDNPLYIFAFNGAVYIVEMKENRVEKVEFRNPAFYDTSYGNYDYTQNEKAIYIYNDYGFSFNEKDFIKYENGKLQLVWKGKLKDNQPDKESLFRFRGVIDCLNGDNNERLKYICENRSLLIKAKYMHDIVICKDKKDCFINANDI